MSEEKSLLEELITGTPAGVQAATNLLYLRLHEAIRLGRVQGFGLKGLEHSRYVINQDELAELLASIREQSLVYASAPVFQKLAQGEKLERMCIYAVNYLDGLHQPHHEDDVPQS